MKNIGTAVCRFSVRSYGRQCERRGRRYTHPGNDSPRTWWLSTQRVLLDHAQPLQLPDRVAGVVDVDPAAVFANDATIPFQHERGDPDRLADYCEGATTVLNAFESDELGTSDAVSRAEPPRSTGSANGSTGSIGSATDRCRVRGSATKGKYRLVLWSRNR